MPRAFCVWGSRGLGGYPGPRRGGGGGGGVWRARGLMGPGQPNRARGRRSLPLAGVGEAHPPPPPAAGSRAQGKEGGADQMGVALARR